MDNFFSSISSEFFSVIVFVVPVVSAFIGWLTNFFAIKMLFHPRKKIKLLFLSLQGVIPANRHRIADRLSETVSSSLLSTKELKQKILENNQLDEIIFKEINQYLESFLKIRLTETIPMASMFVSDQLIQKIRDILIRDLENEIPHFKNKLVEKAVEFIDVKAMVQEKIQAFSLEKFESIMLNLLKKEFRFVEVTGAVIGFLIGCLQLLIFYI